MNKPFRGIDPVATGANIVRLRKERGLTVRDLQAYFGFEEPQAIYKWQRGQSLPTVDNLYALGALLEVSMDDILVQSRPKLNIICCQSSLLLTAFTEEEISAIRDTMEVQGCLNHLAHPSDPIACNCNCKGQGLSVRVIVIDRAQGLILDSSKLPLGQYSYREMSV